MKHRPNAGAVMSKAAVDARRALFLADFAAGNPSARRLGSTAEAAYAAWKSGTPATAAGKGGMSRAEALRKLDAMGRKLDYIERECRALRRTAVSKLYKAGSKWVVHKLPCWPIFEAVRDTNSLPGTSYDWRQIGQAA